MAAVVPKPIPALYTVYILRSTVRHASLYIGSTPHPPRRLKQHNGQARGGAARTSRNSLRPWEMVGLVSGFPGMTAALKFEFVPMPRPALRNKVYMENMAVDIFSSLDGRSPTRTCRCISPLSRVSA